MAKPPDGSSAWVKHDDVHVLGDDDGVFASLIVPVAGNAASIIMPFSDSSSDSFYVARFEVQGSGVTVALDGGAAIDWQAAIAIEGEKPIWARRRFDGANAEQPARARLRIGEAGLSLFDSRGRLRVFASRARGDGLAIATCAGSLWLNVPTHQGCTVSQVASSLP